RRGLALELQLRSRILKLSPYGLRGAPLASPGGAPRIQPAATRCRDQPDSIRKLPLRLLPLRSRIPRVQDSATSVNHPIESARVNGFSLRSADAVGGVAWLEIDFPPQTSLGSGVLDALSD